MYESNLKKKTKSKRRIGNDTKNGNKKEKYKCETIFLLLDFSEKKNCSEFYFHIELLLR